MQENVVVLLHDRKVNKMGNLEARALERIFMEVGEVSGYYKFVKPVSLSDILVDIEETTKDFIIFRIHCKYDTQATGDEIIEKLKKLDKLNKGIEILKNEIEQTKQIVNELPEYEQQASKLFLDGLLQALYFIESE